MGSWGADGTLFCFPSTASPALGFGTHTDLGLDGIKFALRPADDDDIEALGGKLLGILQPNAISGTSDD